MKHRPALAGLGLLLVATAPGVRAETPEVLTEKINFNIGCQRTDEAPTCDSTQYWLGTGVGEDSVASTLDATPLGWAFYHLDGGYTPTSFTGDDTLRDSYILVGGSTITGQIALSGFAGGAEVGVDSAVAVTIVGRTIGTNGRPVSVQLGTAEVTKVVSTPADTVYEFEMVVPATLDGKAVDRLSAEVGQRHITVLQNGFMDGEGGSFFELPYVLPAEEDPVEEAPAVPTPAE